MEVPNIETLQLCKDCINFKTDSYEKHLQCKSCNFIGNKQSNFNPKQNEITNKPNSRNPKRNDFK